MDDDRRRLESLNPEPDGSRGWPDSPAGRRAYDRVQARLDAEAADSPEPGAPRWRTVAMIAAPAVAVFLAIGLPLLLLRGGGAPVTTAASGATTAATTTAAVTTQATTTLPPAPVQYTFSGMVLDKEGVGPELCMAVAESLPPQCRGVPVVGLNWADVSWAETAGDTTWAEARLVGTFDGEQFALTQAPEPADLGPGTQPEGDPFASPCPEPAGGWVVTDPALASDAAFAAAQAYAEAQPDYAGLWLDQLGQPSEWGTYADSYVVNVAFTGDLAARETDLRSIYGGPLCVSGAERTAAELEVIQNGLPVVLASAEAEAAGIYAVGGASYGTDVAQNAVVATVFAVAGDGQAWLDARYGVGAVILSSMLQPVEVP
jgi:hypothetical protein